MAAPLASSSTEGFFQELPVLAPVFSSSSSSSSSFSSSSSSSSSTSSDSQPEDVPLSRVLRLYIPENETTPARAIHNVARRALDPDVLAHAVDAEVNTPVLKSYNTFGRENKSDPLWTTEGWKRLKQIGQEEGVVAAAYENAGASYNRRVHQFAVGHVWVCTSTMTVCPTAMTDGAAKLLGQHQNDKDGDQPGRQGAVRDAFRRLTSRDPNEAWTSGQWMTERSGGSDVSGTETVARRLSEQELAEAKKQGSTQDAHGNALGPWTIDGFKWFSSATDSEMVLMLAQTGKGLGLFYAPMRRIAPGNAKSPSGKPLTELNGIRIQRLKSKIGTKSLPTAELELKGVRGWLIGEEGKGVREISMILNLTRLHTGCGGTGYWSRALHVSRAYARIRKVKGGLLQDNPAHLRWMANNVVQYTAATQFGYFCVAMLGAQEQGWDKVVKSTLAAKIIPSNEQELSALFRLLTPVLKAQVSVASVLGMREHMEALGGVGYCENNEDGGVFNIAKIFRDNLVSPIWEGTVSVMAEDVVRVMADKRIAGGKVVNNVFVPWARRVLDGCNKEFRTEVAAVQDRLDALAKMETDCSKEELVYRGRELLEHIEAIVCGIALLYDASSDGDEVAAEVARRYIRQKALPGFIWGADSRDWRYLSAMDRRIFLGISPIIKNKL
ncbi:hypothetical protein ANO11243_010360 [Dothideomycetidae sp. 11243]|nr:hypothetical protein ANO11243_010360 [fungal sp. No.11243]